MKYFSVNCDVLHDLKKLNMGCIYILIFELDNEFTDEGGKYLALSLSKNKMLQTLWIYRIFYLIFNILKRIKLSIHNR